MPYFRDVVEAKGKWVLVDVSIRSSSGTYSFCFVYFIAVHYHLKLSDRMSFVKKSSIGAKEILFKNSSSGSYNLYDKIIGDSMTTKMWWTE